MKRISKECRAYLAVSHRVRWSKAERRQKRLLASRRRCKLQRDRRRLEERRKIGGRRIRLPESFSLYAQGARTPLIDTLQRIRKHAADPAVHTVTLDFTKVETLHPCGTLLFVAEIERLLAHEACAEKLKCTYPKNDVVEQLFQHIGMLQRLGLEPRKRIEAENVIVWLYEVGHEDNLDSIIGSLPDLLKSSGNKALRMAVTSGMTEAVANSAEHAYIHRRKDGTSIPVPHDWWIFAREEDNEISVSICDLGIGIPRSLPQTFPEELATFMKTRRGRKKLDHQMIELALRVGRTRTNKPYRGQGLKDILKVVKEQRVGQLRIYSNKGVYILNGSTGYTNSHSEASSIMGTIVQWRIPLAAFNS